MSKIKNGGLHQFGAEPFEEEQLGITSVEGVQLRQMSVHCRCKHYDILQSGSRILVFREAAMVV